MKYILLLLIFNFSLAQSIVFDGKSGTTTITPAGGTNTFKSKQIESSKKVSLQEVKKTTNLQSYTLTGVNMSYARLIKNQLISINYSENPDENDEKSFSLIRDFIKSNRLVQKSEKTISITVSKKMAENIIQGIYLQTQNLEELKKQYDDNVLKFQFKDYLKNQINSQEDKNLVSPENKIRQ